MKAPASLADTAPVAPKASPLLSAALLFLAAHDRSDGIVDGQLAEAVERLRKVVATEIGPMRVEDLGIWGPPS